MSSQLVTSSSAASPANRTASPASGRRRRTRGTSGKNSPVLLALLDPHGLWRKTFPDSSQVVLTGFAEHFLPEFCGTWPPSGSMRSGKVFQLRPWVPRTFARGSSWLPTPTTNDGRQTAGALSQAQRSSLVGHVMRSQLLPTPTKADGKRAGTYGRGNPTLTSVAKDGDAEAGSLNPEWVELVMGVPLHWTDLGE